MRSARAPAHGENARKARKAVLRALKLPRRGLDARPGALVARLIQPPAIAGGTSKTGRPSSAPARMASGIIGTVVSHMGDPPLTPGAPFR